MFVLEELLYGMCYLERANCYFKIIMEDVGSVVVILLKVELINCFVLLNVEVNIVMYLFRIVKDVLTSVNLGMKIENMHLKSVLLDNKQENIKRKGD